MNNLLLLLTFLTCGLSLNSQHSDWLIKFSDHKAMTTFVDQGIKSNIADKKILSSRKQIISISTPSFTKDQVLEMLGDKGIVDVYPNHKIVKRGLEPNDEFFPQQWNMKTIGASDAWEFHTGGGLSNGEEVVIALLDDGFDVNHPEIANNIWVNKAEIPNDNIDNDDNGVIDDVLGFNVKTWDDDHPALRHGSQVMGVVGAKGDNEEGIAGINWNTKLLLISGIDVVGEIILAMDHIVTMKEMYLESNGVKGANILVTNLSAGLDNSFPDDSPDWCSFYDDAGAVGILSVGAATNNESDVDLDGDLPSTCPSDYLIAVTNTDRNDIKVRSSGFSTTHIDLGAPGEGVLSLDVDNSYSQISGTSASAPHVAGAIALMYNTHCDKLETLISESPAEAALLVKQFIMNGVDPLNSLSRTVSKGRVNIFGSLLSLSDYCSGVESEDLDIKKAWVDWNGLNVEYTTKIFSKHELFIFDAIGRMVHRSEFTPEIFGAKLLTPDIDNLGYNSGYYFATISNEEEVVSLPFVVVR